MREGWSGCVVRGCLDWASWWVDFGGGRVGGGDRGCGKAMCTDSMEEG